MSRRRAGRGGGGSRTTRRGARADRGSPARRREPRRTPRPPSAGHRAPRRPVRARRLAQSPSCLTASQPLPSAPAPLRPCRPAQHLREEPSPDRSRRRSIRRPPRKEATFSRSPRRREETPAAGGRGGDDDRSEPDDGSAHPSSLRRDRQALRQRAVDLLAPRAQARVLAHRDPQARDRQRRLHVHSARARSPR